MDGAGGSGLFSRETGREKFSILPGDIGDMGGLVADGEVALFLSLSIAISCRFSAEAFSEWRSWARIPLRPGSGVWEA
jgi:hypothetical protein